MKRGLAAVIFDIDGTLTVPSYDFKAWRQALSSTFPGRFATGDLLVEAESLSPPSRQRAMDMIHELEDAGRRKFALQPGVLPTIELLNRHGVRRAVITRNSRHTVDLLNNHLGDGLAFEIAVDRSFNPPKPAPAAAWHVMETMGLQISSDSNEHVWFVGDSHDDVLCAQGARMTSIFIRNRHEHFEERFTKHGDGVDEHADMSFDTMSAFHDWLQESWANIELR